MATASYASEGTAHEMRRRFIGKGYSVSLIACDYNDRYVFDYWRD